MINVVKRDGTKAPLSIAKLQKVTAQACEGLVGVSASEIEIKSQIQFYNNIKTTDIQETIIKAASELITEENPNYQYVAGRLINYHLRKEVYGKFEPDDLFTHIKRIVDLKYYDVSLLELYSEEEIIDLDKYIEHDRDDLLTYAAMEQMRGKYLVKNRSTNEFYETPQMAFMLIAMTLFGKYTENRLMWVKDFYDAVSTFDISMPTPIMAGVRTPQRQFSSCVLIETDDSLDSINATNSAIVKYVSQKAGIGIGGGKLRAKGSIVRNGDVVHTGVIPFYKLFQAGVKSCSQGGVRGGAATLYYPIWHLEVEDLLVLKNNKGVEENRIRQMDYGVQFNQLMYEKLINGEDITLFSPNDVPDLYEAFYTDQDKFRVLYEKYSRAYKIRKKTIPAYELFSAFITERSDTGRIYFMNVDHVNTHGSFIERLAPIRMSNLCVEVTLPTKPLEDIKDPEGEIGICILGAINWGKIRKISDFAKPCELVVRALNEVIDYQSYPVIAAELSTRNRRSIGVGIINLAYWMARNDMTYTNPNLGMIHQYAEAWSYYLIKASADLAKERGTAAPKFNETKYSQALFPIDTYKKEVDELVDVPYNMNWTELKNQVLETGMMNSTLMALMPSETSSQISNSTNGIDPPRGPISIKVSKDGILTQVVPENKKLKNKYEYLWDQKSPRGYLSIMAVLQKFIDMSISTNTSYNPQFYPNEKVPESEVLGDMLWCYKYGIKTGYYYNTNDNAGEIDVHAIELPYSVPDEEDCESCKI